MDLQRAALQLSAAADPSRLRLLVALRGGEASVGDLVTILQHSQPRVSRHLGLLVAAGLVEAFRESRSVYYRWAEIGLNPGLTAAVEALAASCDPTLTEDQRRWQTLGRQRELDALRRTLKLGRAPALQDGLGDPAFPNLLHTLLGPQPLGDVLVVGCGSGGLLSLLLSRARSGAGTDPSAAFRQLARARLRRTGLSHWTLRAAEAWALPFPREAFDLVVLQEAVGASTAREAVFAEVARMLRPGGRLLLLDRRLPTDPRLPKGLTARGFLVTGRRWLPGRSPDRALLLASRPVVSPTLKGTYA